MYNENPHWVKENISCGDKVVFVCSECDSDFPDPNDVCPVCESQMAPEIDDQTEPWEERKKRQNGTVCMIVGGKKNVHQP